VNVTPADRIVLPFDTGSVTLEAPRNVSISRAGDVLPEPVADLGAALDEALERPLHCDAFDRIVPRLGRIALLVGDATRGRTTVPVLDGVLGRLSRLGAGPERVTIVLATGMHRLLSDDELARHFGPIARGYGIVQHDARDDSRLAGRGTTTAGTPCSFLRLATEAALVIGVGAVTFHYFAGFGGGRKLLLPGIAAEKTILANHRLSLGPGAEHRSLAPGCAPGSLDGNPVHEDMLEGARLLGPPVFMVNVVAGADGEPAFVCAGDIDASHRKAAAFLAERCSIGIERPFRVVIASAGGSPHDVNLLQSHKAIRHASRAVADGGLLLFAAACPEGIGSPSLEGAFERGRDEVPVETGRRYSLNAQAAVSIWEMTRRIRILLCSRLGSEAVRRFGFEPWDPREAADIISREGAGGILVLPDAARVLPVLAP
jgi:nickel-dependent lactate racemase